MKKKLLPLFLAVCMLISMLPITALAAENKVVTVTIAGTQLYDEAQDVVALVNQERAKEGLPAVTHNATLNALAMQRAAETALYWDHTRPDGEKFSTVLSGQYSDWTRVGENIAAGQDDAADVMTSWMNSQGHKENILDSRFTQIGVGAFYCNGVICWVQLFGNSTSNTVESTNTGDVNIQVDVETLVSHLNLYTYGETALAMDVGDKETFAIVSANSEFSSMKAVLVPQISNIKSSNGTTIASVKADFNGQLTITAKNEGTGSVALPVYDGQENPVTLTVTVGGHEHSYTKTVTKPTCTADGYTTYTCSCGDSYTDDEVPALGHSWDNGVITKEPTEESTGVRTYTCTACDATKTETIPVLEHEHSYTAVVTAPTCTEGGYTTYTCSCGENYTDDVVTALGHSWNNGEVTQAPTEESTGIRTYTCTVCGETKTETIPMLNHEHSYTAVVTAPTCTEGGYTTYTCSCGERYTDDQVPAAGHDWGDGEVTKAPTEESTGVRTYTCAVCGATKTETIPMLEHEHSYTAVVTAPTCTEGGYTTYTCSCGDTYTADEVEALGHTWDDGVVTEEATEDTDGLKTYTCTVCGDTKTEVIPSLNHEHSYTTVVTAPTCTEAGYTTYTCGCGKTYTADEVAALGHSWGEWETIKAPTATEAGVQERSCTVCGDTETRTLAALGNPFTDVSEEAYYYDAVLWAVENGITTGTTTTTFSPDEDCTRAQIVTFLWRAAGEPKPASDKHPFTDLDSSQYYYDAVLWAVENGITTGTSDTTFSPDATCTRAQVATFLWRAAGKPNPENPTDPFTDLDEEQYYYTAVLWAVEQEITNGMGNGEFQPHTTCTRGQIVTFLYRAAE